VFAVYKDEKMKTYSLARSQSVGQPTEVVFEFFSKPENLALLTPRNLGFSILTPLPIAMNVGAVIDYTITILGIPVRWTTLITAYAPPRRFVDVQLRGPYAFWHHTHSFVESGDGTVVSDEVVYAMRGGLIGRLLHRLFIRKRLDKIFAHRRSAIDSLFSQRSRVAEHQSPQEEAS
jgi:ligand-binding SRPBCC domain-containing protein